MMALALALAAATCFALCTVLQQHAAAQAPRHLSLRLGLVAFVWRHPRWLIGQLVGVVAVALQAAALAHGSLVLVQPTLAFGVVIALALDALMKRARIGVRSLVGAAVLTAGIGAFLIIGSPTPGLDRGPARAWALAIAAAAVLVVVCGRAARRAGEASRPALFAFAGAAVYAISGGLLKQSADLWPDRGWHILAEPALWGFIVIGLCGTVLVQSAFHAGSLSASIGVLTAAEPVLGALVGIGVFHERLRVDSGSVALIVLSGAAVAVGVLAVTSHSVAAPAS
jgi:drug/metabolite transporter (DMT)-like permease